MLHAFNPQAWDAEAGRILSSRPACSTVGSFWTARATQKNQKKKKTEKMLYVLFACFFIWSVSSSDWVSCSPGWPQVPCSYGWSSATTLLPLPHKHCFMDVLHYHEYWVLLIIPNRSVTKWESYRVAVQVLERFSQHNFSVLPWYWLICFWYKQKDPSRNLTRIHCVSSGMRW